MSRQESSAELPEIGTQLKVGELSVNYHDRGDGPPLLLIHGSGPGVSAWANWRAVLPRLAETHRIIAPDMLGFGYTDGPEVKFDIHIWLEQLTGLLDALGIERVSVIGNSFGGSLALHLAQEHPERVERLVLMGPAATPFVLTEGLDAVWGYEVSLDAMSHLLREVFVYDGASIADDLVRMRFEASARPTVQERYSALFPAPRQRWVDALGLTSQELGRLEQPVLIVHGRDDRVIPLEASERAAAALPHGELQVIDQCGHWVQIEHTEQFCNLVEEFFSRTESHHS